MKHSANETATRSSENVDARIHSGVRRGRKPFASAFSMFVRGTSMLLVGALLFGSLPALAQQAAGDQQPTAGLSDADLAAILDQIPQEDLNALFGAEINLEFVDDTVVITGPEDQVKTFELFLRTLDETGEEKVLELVRVERRDANELAQTIEPVLQEMTTQPNRPAEDEISIKALSATLLIVSALPSDMDLVLETIELADEDDGFGEFEQLVFPIKYRRASEVGEELSDILKKLKERQGESGTKAETQVIPNNANNTLLVIAPESERQTIQKLIDELDVEPVEGFSELKLTIFPLRHSKANDLADVVTSLLEESESNDDVKETILRLQISKALPDGTYEELPEIDLAKTTQITPDEGTNSLIVKAAAQNLEPMRALIELLDGVPSADELSVRLYPLRFADAESVRDTLQEMFDKGKELPKDPDGSGEGAVPTDKYGVGLVYDIGLHADSRTNTLIFAGRETQLSVVEKVVNELDRPARALKFPLTLITLNHADATRVSQILEGLINQRIESLEATDTTKAAIERERVFVSVDIRSNGLLIAASDENINEIREITSQLDAKRSEWFDQIRLVTCKRLSATDLKTKIDELWARKGTLRSNEELLEDLPIVVADERSNTLVVASNQEDFEEITQLVNTLESQPLINDTRLFELKEADATVMAAMLEELFTGMESQSETFKAPTLMPDPRSNALVVAATRDTMERVVDLVRRLDVKAGPMTAVFRVYQLANSSAVKVAPRMQELFDSRQEGNDLTRTPIVILPEESTNTVLCSASRDDQEAIQELIGLLDQPSNMAAQFRIFPLKMAKASVVAEKLDELLQTQQEGSQGLAIATAVSADERTNALIVWASPSEMENITAVVKDLDTATPAVEMMVKIIQLRQALAEDFESLLTEGLLGEDAGSDQERAVILSWTETLPDGRQRIRKLLRQDVSIKADPRTNSLMVMAPAGSIAMLEAMIRDFDSIRPIQSEIRLFPLINADAQAMVEQLTEIFEADSSEGETVRQMNFGDAFGDLDFARVGQELRLSADARTNTIIAAGAEVDLRMVEELVRYLDAQEAEDRIVEVVQANFRPAQDLAAAVQSFNQQEQDVIGELDDEQSQQRRADALISIEAVGDPEQGSSSLIVGTSRRRYPETMRMIRDLDRPEPQVMISVLLAEVGLRDSVELGVEIAGQELNFSEEAVIGPNGVIQGEQFDYVVGTSLGAAPTGLGGFNFTVSGEDFSFLLHALQQESRVETLQRPTLMVRNGEEGSITIADQVPFVESSQLNDTGSTNSVIGREDVGIVLTATPNISPDGYVTIALAAEASSFAGQDLQLTEGVASPIFQTRELATNVTVRDGETIVVGGLITTSDEDSESKIPILGDLPYLGFMFRNTGVSQDKTELLIVLTVDILRTDEDMREKSIRQRDNFIMTDNIRQSPLMEGLRITPDGIDASMGAQPNQSDPGMNKSSQPKNQATPPETYGPKPKTYGPKAQGKTTAQHDGKPVYGPVIREKSTEPEPIVSDDQVSARQ
ncbi:MAG: secretin N-terminal domain-containing protein [Phycisphaerae bacterium]